MEARIVHLNVGHKSVTVRQTTQHNLSVNVLEFYSICVVIHSVILNYGKVKLNLSLCVTTTP